jgi:hypothetical protein
LLLLFSSGWVLNTIQNNSGYIVFPIIAWGLSEFFVRQRKMSLPAIVLLIAFIGGIFGLYMNILSFSDSINTTIAASLSTLGAYLHWLRFKVPITVAAGSVSLIGFLVALSISIFPETTDYLLPILLIFGIITFVLAMFWDYADIHRVTYKSDVAFWLHLASAPLIIHPIFGMLGVLDGGESISTLMIVIALYVFMSLLSIAVDRRAFMVSSMVYVLYAISSILEPYGDDKRIAQENNPNRIEMMKDANPKYILRNYLAEIAIRKAEDDKDYSEIDTLFNLLSHPKINQQIFSPSVRLRRATYL